MFKLYRKSQQIQYDWIRKHPGQYVVLNATIALGFLGYFMYQDRQYERELSNARMAE